MIWALLALLGVPIWLIVGVLGGVWLTRRAFRQQPGVFEVAVRAADAEKWPRGVADGRIVSDVLIINRGAALLRTDIRAIDVSGLDIGDGPKRPGGAVGRSVLFADGSRDEVAVAADIAEQLDAAVR